MPSTFRTGLLALVLSALLCHGAVMADDTAVQGRKILEKNKAAVVTVLLVMKQKISFPGAPSRESESKGEATGTVINAEGLTVISLSEADPSALVEAMLAGSGQSRNMEMETEMQDVQIMLADGTEVPAKVILRDKDLDMAFVRPIEKPDRPFAFVNIENSGEPEILDPVITLNRLGKVANRAHSASVERINAVVKRPRTFYIPGNDPTNTALGSPTFTVDGKFVGVFLMRAIKTTGSGGALGGMFGGMGDNIASIIVPAEDIAYAAEQAPPFDE